DGYVVKLDPSKTGAQAMVFGTFLGGVGEDQGLDCVVDTSGVITVVGFTQSGSGLATTPGAFRRVYAGNEGYVLRLSSDGRQVLYSTLLGGSAGDGAWLVARHKEGIATVLGATLSSNFPTLNPLQSAFGGVQDGFVTRVAMIPTGTTRYGSPTAGTNGWPTIHALSDATSGNTRFGLGCSRAPINKSGVLLLSARPLLPSFQVLGIKLHVDLNMSILVPVVSNARGESSLPVTYPTGGLGSTIYAQYAWLEVTNPLSLSASDALAVR
ncbi:MAG: hypothetical protein V3U11_09975, partial [Planctomycetota bacterium]